MKILSFHLQGKMAHFRRYYSNSSALTYTIPPRTTLIGILAGLLGYPRDSYYEQFSLDECKIAVGLVSPIKKQVQKMNLLMIDGPNDFNGSKEHHSQTPTELILPLNIQSGIIDYKVWVHHKNESIMYELERLLTVNPCGFCSRGISLSLGTANHLGWLVLDGIMDGEDIIEETTAVIHSVIPLKWVKEIQLMSMRDFVFRLIKEDILLEFDSERRLTARGKGTMLINLCSTPIPVRISRHVKLKPDNTAIIWME